MIRRRHLTSYIMASSFMLASLTRIHSVAGRRSAFVGSTSHALLGCHHPNKQLLQRCLSSSSGEVRTSTADTSINEEANQDEQSNRESDTWQNPRSRWARRKHRKNMERLQKERQGDDVDDNGGLNWESFEFGCSPKMDKRFNSRSRQQQQGSAFQTRIPDEVINTIRADSATFKSYLQSETTLDQVTSNQFKESQSDLLSLSPETIQRSIDILTPYIQPRRLERIEQVLSSRTKHTRFLFENPSNPSNVWACLRTLDSFGIQYVDVIIDSSLYEGKAAVMQKRGMRTAMGSACWMTLRQFGSIEEAIQVLREEEGCLIYASDLNPASKDVRDLKWDVDYEPSDSGAQSNNDNQSIQRPICVVMGNEDRGISNKMRELADETFYLPMCGFAESFNLSVATAIALAYMSAVSSRSAENGTVAKGPLRPGDLDQHELQSLRLRGVLNSLAQKRMGKALLMKEGIILPDSLYK